MIEIYVDWDQVLELVKLNWGWLVLLWYFLAFFITKYLWYKTNGLPPYDGDEYTAQFLIWIISPLFPIFILVLPIYLFYQLFKFNPWK